MGDAIYPEDIDPESGCRLPLPRREQLDDAGRRIYDSLADPQGGTIRGLRGPGRILLHNPELSRHARPLKPVSSTASLNGQRTRRRRSASVSPPTPLKSSSTA